MVGSWGEGGEGKLPGLHRHESDHWKRENEREKRKGENGKVSDLLVRANQRRRRLEALG